MFRILFCTLFLLGITFSGSSCINTYLTRLDGTSLISQSDGTAKFYPKKHSISYWKKKSRDLLLDYRRTDSIEYYSDYGVALILLREYNKAKRVFLAIEKQKPDLYITASNLGTLYELTGNVDSALYWIRKSVHIFPDSHEGSEWIHIRILEFKLKKHKHYNRSVLQLNFGREAKPGNPQHYDLRKLESHLRHQLKERINFIPAPDPIIANLYFDYGNIIAQEASVEHALTYYKEAKRYGYKDEMLAIRMEEMEAISRGNWTKTMKETIEPFLKEHPVLSGCILLIGFVGLMLFFRWVYIRRKRKKASLRGGNHNKTFRND